MPVALTGAAGFRRFGLPESRYAAVMTRDEIDDMINAMQAEAAKGDPDAVAGAIYINSTTWVDRMSQAVFPTTCLSPGEGIRYRGVRVLISSLFENRVANRAECGDQGQPFMDVDPRS